PKSGQRGAKPQPTRAQKAQTVPKPPTPSLEPKTGLTAWNFGDLPATVETSIWTGTAHQHVTGYPALQAEEQAEPSAALVILRTEGEQRAVHRGGVIALLQAELPNPQRYILDHLSATEKLAFAHSPYKDSAALVTD